MNNKILVIDDDPDILEPISLLLEGEGYHVQVTPKGEETYQRIHTFQPDIILLDYLMSGSDGRTICKNLKKDTATKHIPILMMSAHPNVEDSVAQFGADGFVAKPFDIQVLLEHIKRHLT